MCYFNYENKKKTFIFVNMSFFLVIFKIKIKHHEASISTNSCSI